MDGTDQADEPDSLEDSNLEWCQGDSLPEVLRDRYQAMGHIGSGAFGVVLRARDRVLDRMVAIKLLTPLLERSERRRFESEASSLARLRHPGVVQVYDYGVGVEDSYLIMELLEGSSLAQRPPAPEEALEIMIEVGQTLDAVHGAGLVHRDVKPANLLRNQDGRVVLIDFGLVHDPDAGPITETGAIVGTLPFIAPELLRGARPSPAADWYSWGVCLYWMLKGHYPFEARDLLKVADGAPLPALDLGGMTVGREVERLLTAALTEDPRERVSSTRVACVMLEQGGARASQVPRSRGGPPNSRWRAARERRLQGGGGLPWRRALTGCVLGLAVAAVGAWVGPAGRREVRERQPPLAAATAPTGRSERRDRLRQALGELAARHAPEDRPIDVAIRDQGLLEHLSETVADYLGEDIVDRWRRLLEACVQWLTVASPAELDGALGAELFRVLRHMLVDEQALRFTVLYPEIYLAPGAARDEGPGFDADRLRARLDELKAERRLGLLRLKSLEPGPEQLVFVTLLQEALLPAERAGVWIRVSGRLGEVADPVTRLRLATAAQLLLPETFDTPAQFPCELREQVLSASFAALRSTRVRPGVADPLRDACLGLVAPDHFLQLQTCRKSLVDGDLEDLRYLADSLENRLAVAPGAVRLGVETVSALHRFGASVLMPYGDEFRVQLERILELASHTRGDDQSGRVWSRVSFGEFLTTR